MPEANEATAQEPTANTDESLHSDNAEIVTDWVAEARKWEKRSKENNARADAAKSEADKLAELVEANKNELLKANERVAQLEKELQEKREAAERAAEIDRVASATGVDRQILAAMSGDVEANAELLKTRMKPAYPSVFDGGEAKTKGANEDSPEKAFADWLKSKR